MNNHLDPNAITAPRGHPPQSAPYRPLDQPTPAYPPPVVYVPPQFAHATPQMTYQITERVEKGIDHYALLSLIAGIVTIPFLCTFGLTGNLPVLPALVALGAIVPGHLAIASAPRAGVSRSNGMAITGLVIGYLILAICVVWTLLKLHAQTGG